MAPLLVGASMRRHYIKFVGTFLLYKFVFCAKPSFMGDFYAVEASRLAGFEKPWMLIHLERSGIFVRESFSDRRHGRVRKYNFKDLIVIRGIKKMLDIGLRPARVKDVLLELAKEESLPTTREAAEVFARRSCAFFISSDSVLFAKSDKEVVNLSKGGQLSFAFMISVSSIAKELETVVALYEPKRKRNWKVDQPVLEELCRAAGL
jgi:DNA-binding transcriptional MerR regulator